MTSTVNRLLSLTTQAINELEKAGRDNNDAYLLIQAQGYRSQLNTLRGELANTEREA